MSRENQKVAYAPFLWPKPSANVRSVGRKGIEVQSGTQRQPVPIACYVDFYRIWLSELGVCEEVEATADFYTLSPPNFSIATLKAL